MRYLVLFVVATIALPLAGCSEQTRDAASQTADSAAEDAAKNLDAAGEVLEQGAADAAREVSENAAALEDNLRDGDNAAEVIDEAPVTD